VGTTPGETRALGGVRCEARPACQCVAWGWAMGEVSLFLRARTGERMATMTANGKWASGGKSHRARVSPVPLYLFLFCFHFLFLSLTSNFIIINQACVSN
jgi:hypothetical protein